jgi:hypothetical protein
VDIAQNTASHGHHHHGVALNQCREASLFVIAEVTFEQLPVRKRPSFLPAKAPAKMLQDDIEHAAGHGSAPGRKHAYHIRAWKGAKWYAFLRRNFPGADYAARQKAQKDLGGFGELAQGAYQRAVAANATLEVRQRIESLGDGRMFVNFAYSFSETRV